MRAYEHNGVTVTIMPGPLGAPASGEEYRRIEESLIRLRSTEIKTRIETGGRRVRRGFDFIDDWEIVERSSDGRMEAIELTLSESVHNAIRHYEVLANNRDDFRLTGGLEQRLHERARKHCGTQASWSVSGALLQKKCGSAAELREPRRMLRAVAEGDRACPTTGCGSTPAPTRRCSSDVPPARPASDRRTRLFHGTQTPSFFPGTKLF